MFWWFAIATSLLCINLPQKYMSPNLGAIMSAVLALFGKRVSSVFRPLWKESLTNGIRTYCRDPVSPWSRHRHIDSRWNMDEWNWSRPRWLQSWSHFP